MAIKPVTKLQDADDPMEAPVQPTHSKERYVVREAKLVHLWGQSTWVRPGKIISDDMGLGTVAALREQGVKMERCP